MPFCNMGIPGAYRGRLHTALGCADPMYTERADRLHRKCRRMSKKLRKCLGQGVTEFPGKAIHHGSRVMDGAQGSAQQTRFKDTASAARVAVNGLYLLAVLFEHRV